MYNDCSVYPSIRKNKCIQFQVNYQQMLTTIAITEIKLKNIKSKNKGRGGNEDVNLLRALIHKYM